MENSKKSYDILRLVGCSSMLKEKFICVAFFGVLMYCYEKGSHKCMLRQLSNNIPMVYSNTDIVSEVTFINSVQTTLILLLLVLLLVQSVSSAPSLPAPAHHRPQRHPHHLNKNCKEYDITSRTFLSDLVFEGIARTRSSVRAGQYNVTFVVQTILKQAQQAQNTSIRMMLPRKTQQIRLHFKDKRASMSATRTRPHDCPLVRANIKTGSKYFVFANLDGQMNFTPQGEPIVANWRNRRSIQSVLSRKFQERTPQVRGLENASAGVGTPLHLNCVVRGIPVPRIRWYKDGSQLIPTSYLNITYYRKNSTIEIKSLRLSDTGRYECRARSVTKKFASMSSYVNVTTQPTDRGRPVTSADTDWPMHAEVCQVDAFCLNGGKCRFISSIGEHMCICEEGFTGARCDIKDVSTRDWFPSTVEEELMLPALKRLFRRRIRGEPKLSNADYPAVIRSLGANKKFRHWLSQQKLNHEVTP